MKVNITTTVDINFKTAILIFLNTIDETTLEQERLLKEYLKGKCLQTLKTRVNEFIQNWGVEELENIETRVLLEFEEQMECDKNILITYDHFSECMFNTL